MEYLSLKKITALHGYEIQEAVQQVVASGWYLQGQAVATFESEYAHYIGTQHCVSCGNGLDALTLILRAYVDLGVMQPGDEVIVPANTYIASILSITENGLKPILVEPDIRTFQIDDTRIEQAITPRTRAIMIVHLYGRCAYTPTIGNLCQTFGLKLIEDNAQAHGCLFVRETAATPTLPVKTGRLGHAAAHSFYPGKNLGALGDAGAVTTNDTELATRIRALANYGSDRKYVFPYQGRNSRMDELQAAVLSVKLKYLDEDNRRRKTIAQSIVQGTSNPAIILNDTPDRDNVWHILPALCAERDRLQQYLSDNGIQTVIHYPIPPHKQACYKDWNQLSYPITEQIHAQELSLPCNPAMTDDDTARLTEILNRFPAQV